MNRILKVSGLLLMWGVFYACTEAGMAMHEIQKTAKATAEMESDVPMVVAAQMGLLRTEVDASGANLSNILDKQLTESNRQLAKTSQDTLAKVGVSLGHLNTAIDAASNAVGSINTVALDADKLVGDEEIPKVVHSARLTVDAAGQAAVHFEGMSNTIDQQVPKLIDSAVEVSASANDTAKSVQSMAKSGKDLVDTYIKPKRWFVRLKDSLLDGGYRVLGYWL